MPAALGMKMQADMLRIPTIFNPLPAVTAQAARNLEATAIMIERAVRDYPKPAFNLGTTTIDGKTVAVTEETVMDRPYGALKRFRRNTDRHDPKVLILAPMSGHHATLLRGTVETMLPDSDVYITDWKDVRDVPLTAGQFGLDDYIAYVKDMIRALGPDVHVVAVCQPTVPAVAAVALMAADNDPAQPMSLTLMGGPLDVAAAPTEVSEYANKHPLSWFRDNVTMLVPPWHKGAGQLVYPGFLQLTGFVAMNMDKHRQSHLDLYQYLREGKRAEATEKIEFYDEYFSVADMSALFYLETVQKVFQERQLARGVMEWRGQRIDLSKIAKTAVLTVEGERDDIAAPGQTVAIQHQLSGLSRSKQYHYLQSGAGHYGIFNGRRWEAEIAPRVKGFIRQAASENGTEYTAMNDVTENKYAIKNPPLWDGTKTPIHMNQNEKIPHDHPSKKSGARGARLG